MKPRSCGMTLSLSLLAFLVVGCDAGLPLGLDDEAGLHIAVTPDAMSLRAGAGAQMEAAVTDSTGQRVEGVSVDWSSTDTDVVTVDKHGVVRGITVGAALLIASTPGGARDTAHIAVTEAAAQPSNLAPADVAAFILGPQAPVGTHPWPAYDEAATASARKWHDAYMADGPGGTDYYDLALALYQIHARTGDQQYYDMAQDVAMEGWLRMPAASAWPKAASAFAIAPRSTPIAGLTMLALSGVDVPALTFYNDNDPGFSEKWGLWDWLAEYCRRMNASWLERWSDPGSEGVHSGIRDGGMLLRYLAVLAVAHPDADVRAEMLNDALTAARDYYARVQLDDGSWRWIVGGNAGSSQPFQVGLLMEGLIAVHQLTGDAAVREAILKGTEAMWRDQIDHNPVPFKLLPNVPEVMGAFYRVYGETCQPPIGEQASCGNNFDPEGGSFKAGNQLRVIRHRNTLMVHAFGYAYHITGDPKWKTWGDSLFQATYGEPDFPPLNSKGKEFDQAFRSSGRYLGWVYGS